MCGTIRDGNEKGRSLKALEPGRFQDPHWCPLKSTENQTGDNNLLAVCKSLLIDSPGCISQTLILLPVFEAG